MHLHLLFLIATSCIQSNTFTYFWIVINDFPKDISLVFYRRFNQLIEAYFRATSFALW